MSPPIPTAKPTTISRTHAVTKKAPRLTTNKTFTFWKRRTHAHKSHNRVFTTGDRQVQAEKRATQRREYAETVRAAHNKIQGLAEGMKNRFRKHTTAHYYADLIHCAHKLQSTRKINPWNAYQAHELARMKGERGEDLNLTAVNKEISDNWQRLSPEEQQAVTAEPIQKLEEQRESRKLAAHSVPLNSFHDTKSTIQSIEIQLSQLHSRTGTEYMLVVCRSNTEDYVKPYAYYSSDLVQKFFDSSLKRSINDFAIQLEAYVMSGVKGVVENSRTHTLELKKRTASLILEKLNEITGTVHPRMTYDRFDDHITQKYGVIVKNWPLKNFCNPSSVGSRIELETLYNGWHSGVTRFEKLTEQEKARWENEHFSSRITTMSVAPPDSSREPGRSSPLSTLPTPDPKLISNMILLDPSLQNIDPILLAASAPRERQPTAMATTPTIATLSPSLPAPASHLKLNREVFQVITPQSYGMPAKRPRKERKKDHSKKASRVQGTGNIPPSTAHS